ncbi:MAG: hemolysin family protein [Armatimonadota bacterium]|nr:hemolysin family protein [Armatimonadota bacterium]MDW8155210.1 hemolysin family protein [Armatimonadota bacterium]
MEDTGSSLGRFVLFAVLAGVAAFFSLAEVALPRANRQRLRQLSEQGQLRAAVALRLLEVPARTLSTLRAGHALASVGAAVVLASELVARWGAVGAWLAFAASAVVLLVVAEALPRTVAVRWPDAVALWCAVPVRVVGWLVAPLVALVGMVARGVGWPLGLRVSPHAPLSQQEDLDLLARMEEANGGLAEGEREMIHSIFEFRETLVREIMVPRVDVVAVRHDAQLPEIVELVLEEGHSRIPVYRETIDHIVGVVHVKDLFRYLRDGQAQVTAEEVMRPAYYVPETKKVSELFQEMRQNKIHLAVVVDEYGGTAGLVTIEDVLEEIVGEIRDEYDVEEREPLVMLDEHTALVDARMHLEEVNERLGLDLPVGEVDTLGGFVYSRVGHVPQQGEQITYDGVTIRVEELEGQRIARLRVQKLAPRDAEPAPR